MIPSSACRPWPSEQSSNPAEDRQSYTTSRGTTRAKKVKGRKRQVMVDTDGRGLILEVQPAKVNPAW